MTTTAFGAREGRVSDLVLNHLDRGLALPGDLYTDPATWRAWKSMSASDHGPGTTSTGVTHPSSALKGFEFTFVPSRFRASCSARLPPHTIAS